MEIWDAYTAEGEKLEFDLIRGEEIPQGAYHLMAEIYTVAEDGALLLTQRHPEKLWPLKWEITGGSVLKGETAEEGAQRELWEETGIRVSLEDLRPIYTEVSQKNRTIYHCFAVRVVQRQLHIRLQEGETVAWKFLPYPQWKDFLQGEEVAEPVRMRFLRHEDAIEKVLLEKPCSQMDDSV
mgnify:FL=1